MERKINVIGTKFKREIYGTGYNGFGFLRYVKIGTIEYNKRYNEIYFYPTFFIALEEKISYVINEEMEKMREVLNE